MPNNTGGRELKKLSLISLACVTALAVSPVTLAAQEWDFSYSDSSGVTAAATSTASSFLPASI